ncbi:MAG: peptidase [Deltaproteobacteria bacterium]|nr:MAG: peptidase [Deltaproteobacteria bacterium]
MFGNFLYFIIVLLIYSTYQPPEKTNFTDVETLFLFFLLFFLFYYITHHLFKKLEKQLLVQKSPQLVHRFESLITRQSIMAVTFFSINIYCLSLPTFFIDLPVLKSIPTLTALIFISLFLLYLSIIWFHAYGCHSHLNDPSISRKNYIHSNISFSIPVILPWFFLSGMSDIIFLLPLKFPKEVLSTPFGQAVYFLFFLIVAAITAPIIIQKFWGCIPLAPGIHRTRIEAFCRKADVQFADILRWPLFGGRMITAGVMGLVKKFRYILVTPALLQFLDPQELDAVMAHEIGHVKKKHLLFYLVFFAGYMLISFAGFDLLILILIYIEPLVGFLASSGLHQDSVSSIFISIFLILFFILYFRFFFGYFMRNFERQADIYVYELLDSAKPLISSLHKISIISGQPSDKPNWHHFSISERIDYLKKCEVNPEWIHKHHRKVTNSITLFLVGMVLVSAAAYDLNFGSTGKKLNQHLFETMMMRNCESILAAYEKLLSEKPESPEILNNLSWIYATSNKIECQDRKKALALALRAVERKKEAYILDTLAEAYFVNGLIEDAISAENQALSLAKEDERDIYEKQLIKFQNAIAR